jgi:hypothetical protein
LLMGCLKMSKCAYCNKEIETLHPVIAGKDKVQFTCCSDGCENKSVEFFIFFDRHKPHFIIILVIAMIAFFAAVITLTCRKLMIGSILMSFGLALFGLDVLLFPFATPETFSIFGIKKAVLLTRILGALIIVLSLWIGYTLWNS